MEFTLIIPVFKREQHLFNLLRGVQQSSAKPAEIVIVNMGPDVDLDDFTDMQMQVVSLPLENTGELPLAKARNLGAKKATYENLFFLDVDCIPAVDYFETVYKQLDVYKGLIMGTPKYLLAPIAPDFTENDLRKNATQHPYRPVVEGCEVSQNPGQFWSLCFALSKNLFNRIGGFDEAFEGYGAEDTDLAYTLRDKGHYLFISEAIVYHQQHPVHSPPFDKFSQIIKNSTVFYKKWGSWPMGNWLQTFAENQLIDWEPHYKKIEILSKPSEVLKKSAYKEKAPYM